MDDTRTSSYCRYCIFSSTFIAIILVFSYKNWLRRFTDLNRVRCSTLSSVVSTKRIVIVFVFIPLWTFLYEYLLILLFKIFSKPFYLQCPRMIARFLQPWLKHSRLHNQVQECHAVHLC